MNPATPTHAGSGARLPDHDIFVPADYQHRLRLGRCPSECYFANESNEPDLLAERTRWIREAPERHAIALPEAGPALRELAELAARWSGSTPEIPPGADAAAIIARIGDLLEPDLILLGAQDTSFRMLAGSVCFPSSWSPEDKLGLPLAQIHGIVPDLNAELGSAIDGFLARLKPGAAWIRANWGLSASPERNQHPARKLPRLQLPLTADGIWVRIEHQALIRLPRSGFILFGIRIDQRPLSAFSSSAQQAENLGRALRTMPRSMAAYKGLDAVRDAVMELLGRTPTDPRMEQ